MPVVFLGEKCRRDGAARCVCFADSVSASRPIARYFISTRPTDDINQIGAKETQQQQRRRQANRILFFYLTVDEKRICSPERSGSRAAAGQAKKPHNFHSTFSFCWFGFIFAGQKSTGVAVVVVAKPSDPTDQLRLWRRRFAFIQFARLVRRSRHLGLCGGHSDDE